MIAEESIIKAASAYFKNKKIRLVKKLAKGNINFTYEIKVDKTPYIIRAYNEPWKLNKEIFIYREINSYSDVPTPKILYSDDSKSIIPGAFVIMTKIIGDPIDKVYKSTNDASLFEKAGETLSKIHSIKFNKFGWLMDNEIYPSFNTWKDFAWYDIGLKMQRLEGLKEVTSLKNKIEDHLNIYAYLLNVKDKPCLLHKDYHCSHILCDSKDVTGIIDVEWAISGHNENDFIKLELWAFTRFPKARNAFFKGYLKNGHISDDYCDRKKLYELWHWINMVNISYELKNKTWLKLNLIALRRFLR